MLGVEITFSREGRLGTRMIRVSTSAENCVSTVSIVGAARSNWSQGVEPPLWAPNIGKADDADDADANAAGF
jgi:hypothetical protein